MQSFAVVPAAGQSTRLGVAKLLLPWQEKRTLLDMVLSRWKEASLTAVVVVTPSPSWNSELACKVAQAAHAAGAIPVIPSEQPAEMKQSVLLGLQYLDQHFRPSPHDVWLLAPADMPGWSVAVVRKLLETAADRHTQIVVPTCQGRRGHPVVFRWGLTERLKELGPSEGINVFVRRVGYTELPWPDTDILVDVDTWQDYYRWRR